MDFGQTRTRAETSHKPGLGEVAHESCNAKNPRVLAREMEGIKEENVVLYSTLSVGKYFCHFSQQQNIRQIFILKFTLITRDENNSDENLWMH